MYLHLLSVNDSKNWFRLLGIKQISRHNSQNNCGTRYSATINIYLHSLWDITSYIIYIAKRRRDTPANTIWNELTIDSYLPQLIDNFSNHVKNHLSCTIYPQLTLPPSDCQHCHSSCNWWVCVPCKCLQYYQYYYCYYYQNCMSSSWWKELQLGWERNRVTEYLWLRTKTLLCRMPSVAQLVTSSCCRTRPCL